jgi:hypothetical protein
VSTDGALRYALLPRAAANRVYGQAALGLARAELAFVTGAACGGRARDVTAERWGGVDYLAFTVDGGLADAERAIVANLSGTHALFACEGDLLRPVEVAVRAEQDDDVRTIPRYPGKTNEQFTHLLVNVALAAAGDAFARLLDGGTVRLLDPVCGRGTTLNQAIVYGLDAVGLDHDRRALDAYTVFLTTWLKDKRLVHTVDRATLKKGRPAAARRVVVDYGRERKGPRRRVAVVHDDTVRTGDHVPDASVDVLVADLPYGVQHGARPTDGRLRRSPDELLAAALPAWRAALRRSGAMALAWNLRTLDRARMVELVRAAGLHVAGPEDDTSFTHRVDRTITRDVLVATRRGPA